MKNMIAKNEIEACKTLLKGENKEHWKRIVRAGKIPEEVKLAYLLHNAGVNTIKIAEFQKETRC